MDTPTATRPPAPPIELPDKHLAELLAWASWHDDPTVAAQGEQIRTAVTALTERRTKDAELAEIADEAEQLEKRLTELRTRQAELQPTPTKPQRDYNPKEVRAWARTNGVPVPDRGHVPNTVVDAWRKRATTPTASQ